MPSNGCLEHWPKQGILLLNRKFTVDKKTKKTGHTDIGWEDFSAAIIRALSKQHGNLIFLLWGSPAKQVKTEIDANRHAILETRHPSAQDKYLEEFLNCRHFSQTNEFLQLNGKTPIDWLK